MISSSESTDLTSFKYLAQLEPLFSKPFYSLGVRQVTPPPPSSQKIKYIASQNSIVRSSARGHRNCLFLFYSYLFTINYAHFVLMNYRPTHLVGFIHFYS